MTAEKRPSKPEAFLAFLAKGWVSLHVDARRPGVRVPRELATNPHLVLRYGRNMPVPIPDLRVDGAGVSATLSFSQSARQTFVPWSAVFIVAASDGRGALYEEDAPSDLALRRRAADARPAQIERLTPKQATRLPGWRTTWLRRAIGSGPADRARAEAAIAWLYRDLDEQPPAFRWVDSPRAAVEAWIAEQTRERRPPLGGALQARLIGDLEGQLEAQLAVPLLAQVRETFRGGSWGRITGHVVEALMDVYVNRQPNLHVEEGLLPAFYPEGFQGFGGANLDWVGLHAFCRDVVGARYRDASSERLDQWAAVAHACGWWLPSRGWCLVCERPPLVHVDPRGRLHHPRQAALQFSDGFGLHAWHGTRVPRSWITDPETLEVSHAFTWRNLEQRRAAAEIIGWKRVLERLSPRIIDKNRDPSIGQLLEVELPGMGMARFLKVRCGTGRVFVLSVPLSMRTSLEANAWTYNLDPNLFPLEART